MVKKDDETDDESEIFEFYSHVKEFSTFSRNTESAGGIRQSDLVHFNVV